MIALCTLAVGTRLVSKYVARAHLDADDLFALLAYLANLTALIITFVGLIPSGIGRDIWTLTPHQIDMFGHWFYGLEPLYFLQVGLIKMAILFFYLRIFGPIGLERILWATIAFNAINTVAFMLASILQCNPISTSWTKWDGILVGRCINVSALLWANAGVSIVLDLWMLGLPLSKIRKLNLPWRKKIAAAFMICVGTL